MKLKPTPMLPAILLLSLACCVPTSARLVRTWSYAELVAASDVVAIVERIENKPASDNFPFPVSGVAGSNTLFKVHAIIKGTDAKELVLLHFSYPPGTPLINGARFIHFAPAVPPPGPHQDPDKLPAACVRRYRSQPLWIAFLKVRRDGRFEPATGQYDSIDSFRELHEPGMHAKLAWPFGTE